MYKFCYYYFEMIMINGYTFTFRIRIEIPLEIYEINTNIRMSIPVSCLRSRAYIMYPCLVVIDMYIELHV